VAQVEMVRPATAPVEETQVEWGSTAGTLVEVGSSALAVWAVQAAVDVEAAAARAAVATPVATVRETRRSSRPRGS